MKVVILGSGTGVPVKERGYAGLYVRVGGEHVLLDAGPGTLKQLVRLGVTYLDLDRIFLTHFHPDHCLDLVSILFAMRIPRPARPVGRMSYGARTKPLVIYGPRGLRQLYRRLNTAFHGWIAPRTYRLTFKELRGGAALRLSGWTVRTAPMRHSSGALGYRLEHRGKAMAYSGDTDVCEGIVRLGRGADLLVLECSMTDERKVAGHLTPTECGRIAAQAACHHLVLTHFYPVFQRYDIPGRVRRAFRGKVSLARDLAKFSI